MRYHAKVASVAAAQPPLESDDDDDDADEAEERSLLARLDAGLFTLQRLCIIVGDLLLAGGIGSSDGDLSFPLRSKLYEQGLRVIDVVGVLEEAAVRLRADEAAAEDAHTAAARAADRAHIDSLSRGLRDLAGLPPVAAEGEGGEGGEGEGDSEDMDVAEAMEGVDAAGQHT